MEARSSANFRTRLAVEIGDRVLREAAREAMTWSRPLRLAVNISAVQFGRGDLPQSVQAVLMKTGLVRSDA